MTVQSYMAGRKVWNRPQAMLWADAAPTVNEDGILIPVGYEINSDIFGLTSSDLQNRFLITSDHNRESIDVSIERIEQRQRMANGTMRSYHIADKLKVSTSWNLLPSRSSFTSANFDQETGKPAYPTSEDIQRPYNLDTYYADKSLQYTADGGAGGGELLDWYENHRGPFWVLLSYDKYNNFADGNYEDNTQQRSRTSEYVEAVQMYLSDFQYSVVKRGSTKFDLWNVSITLEEV